MVVPIFFPIGTIDPSISLYIAVVIIIISLVMSYFIFNIHMYDKKWDTRLNELLDEPITKRGLFTTQIGDYEIWTSNYMYSYGNLYKFKGKSIDAKKYPSISTRMKLHKKIKDYDESIYEKEIF